MLCLNGLAWADLNLGQIRSAIHTLQQALALTQTAGDKLGQARIYTTLAAAWSYFCQFDKVLALSQQARDLYLSMGLPPYRPLLHLGMAQWHQDQAEAAQQLFQQLFTEATRQNDTWLAGWAAQLLGRMALQQGQLTQAEQRLEQATQLRRQMGELANQVSDLAWWGRLRLAQGRLDEALAHTGEAVRRQEALRDEAYVFEAADICLAHREVLQAMGDEAAAAHYHHLAQQWHTFLADQLDTVEAQAEFNRMSRYAL